MTAELSVPMPPLDELSYASVADIPDERFNGGHLLIDGDATTWPHLSRQADPASIGKLTSLLEAKRVESISLVTMNPWANRIRGLDDIISYHYGPNFVWRGLKSTLLTKANEAYFRQIADARGLDPSHFTLIDNFFLLGIKAARGAGCDTIRVEPIRRTFVPPAVRLAQQVDARLWRRSQVAG